MGENYSLTSTLKQEPSTITQISADLSGWTNVLYQ
jgi:hypothetical protein